MYESVKKILNDNIKVDMWFIDFEKSYKLKSLIKKLLENNPKTIIVGDDYVFPSVKKAVSSFNIVSCGTSYAINIDLEEFQKKYPIKRMESDALHEQIYNERIKDVLKYKNKDLIIHKLMLMIQKNEFDKVFEYRKHGNWNEQYPFLPKKNTLYHILAYELVNSNLSKSEIANYWMKFNKDEICEYKLNKYFMYAYDYFLPNSKKNYII